jgi:Flp pilus assembly protein TadG
MNILWDRRGYSTTWVAGYLAFVALPLLALALGIGRWAIAAAEVQEAADLAALAAVRDIDVRTFERTGNVVFSPMVYARAAAYANMNTSYLASRHIQVQVTGISAGGRMVTVRCSADVSPIFPEFLPRLVITREGTAEIRMRVR